MASLRLHVATAREITSAVAPQPSAYGRPFAHSAKDNCVRGQFSMVRGEKEGCGPA